MSVKVKLNRSAVGSLLKLTDDLRARAERIASAAGPGMEVEVTVGATRARAVIVTATTEARIAEATDRVLTRSLDAGR